MIDVHATPALLSQTVLSASSGIDWLYQFTNNLDNLTTQQGGAMTQVGLIELSFISFIALVRMVIRWNTSSMTLRFHHHPVQAGDLVEFLMLLIICLLLENYWVNPLPGTAFGLNHLFSYFAQIIVAVLDQNSLKSLLSLIETAATGLDKPPDLAFSQIVCYFAVQILLGLVDAILFFINCSVFIFYGVSALFGPIFIPLLMTRTFRGKFFNFVDVLLSLAMMRAVAAAFIFVWQGFLNGFIQQTFNNDYSTVTWLANFVPCLMVFGAFIVNIAFIPKITQMLFGGGTSLVGQGMGTVLAAAAKAV